MGIKGNQEDASSETAQQPVRSSATDTCWWNSNSSSEMLNPVALTQRHDEIMSTRDLGRSDDRFCVRLRII